MEELNNREAEELSWESRGMEELAAADDFLTRYRRVGGTHETWLGYQQHCVKALSQHPIIYRSTEFFAVVETKPEGVPGVVRTMVVGEWVEEADADTDRDYWEKINPTLEYRVERRSNDPAR